MPTQIGQFDAGIMLKDISGFVWTYFHSLRYLLSIAVAL